MRLAGREPYAVDTLVGTKGRGTPAGYADRPGDTLELGYCDSVGKQGTHLCRNAEPCRVRRMSLQAGVPGIPRSFGQQNGLFPAQRR